MNIDYKKHRGKFLDSKGKVIDNPPADLPFMVLASPWDEVRDAGYKGAVPARCEACACLVGIAPATQDMMAAGRPLLIVCRECFHVLHALHDALDDEGTGK